MLVKDVHDAAKGNRDPGAWNKTLTAAKMATGIPITAAPTVSRAGAAPMVYARIPAKARDRATRGK